MSYGRKGQWEQEEVSESDINKKIIRLKENQQSQGIFLYAFKNLEDVTFPSLLCSVSFIFHIAESLSIIFKTPS